MKRSTLSRRRKPPVDEPGRAEFKEVVWGRCAVCCAEGMVRRHHIIREVDVRRLGGPPWALENGLWVGLDTTCQCHRRHHDAFKRIPLAVVPDSAIGFAIDLFGDELAAAVYLAQVYAAEVEAGAWQP